MVFGSQDVQRSLDVTTESQGRGSLMTLQMITFFMYLFGSGLYPCWSRMKWSQGFKLC